MLLVFLYNVTDILCSHKKARKTNRNEERFFFLKLWFCSVFQIRVTAKIAVFSMKLPCLFRALKRQYGGHKIMQSKVDSTIIIIHVYLEIL